MNLNSQNALAQAAREAIPPEDLQRLVSSIETELHELTEKRAAISKRIAAVKQTIMGLAELFGSEILGPELEDLLAIRSAGASQLHYGLTDLCRSVLNAGSAEPLTVQAFLVHAQEKFPQRLALHKHPATSVRVVLKRLVEYGEAIEAVAQTGVKAWKSASASASEPARVQDADSRADLRAIPDSREPAIRSLAL